MTRSAYVVAATGVMSAIASPQASSAQTMRNFSATRPVGMERLLRATLDFGGGTLVLTSGPSGELYGMRLRYDAERFAPVQQYDPRTNILRLGLAPVGGAGVRVTSRAQLAQTAQLEFSPDVPLALTANIGASEAQLDLGGMMLNELQVRSGASVGRVNFSQPTRGTCRAATFTVGAGHLEVTNVANAGCTQLRVDGGVGGAMLDFSGTWRQNIVMVVDLTMGALALKIPRGVGVQVTAERFLTPFDAEGFVRTGNVWKTANYVDAPRKLTVELKTAMVGVNVEWIRGQ